MEHLRATNEAVFESMLESPVVDYRSQEGSSLISTPAHPVSASPDLSNSTNPKVTLPVLCPSSNLMDNSQVHGRRKDPRSRLLIRTYCRDAQRNISRNLLLGIP
jgi:hypothetical protein